MTNEQNDPSYNPANEGLIKFTAKDVKDVGQKVYDRWTKQMPILEEAQQILSTGGSVSLTDLIPIIHNLSVIANDRIYKLILPTFMVFSFFSVRSTDDNYRKRIYTSRNALRKLRNQERRSANSQKSIDENCRQHVEFDMSLFYVELMNLVVEGRRLTDEQVFWIGKAKDVCKEITDESIERGKVALENAKAWMS